MSDENTSAPATSNASDSPPESIAAASPDNKGTGASSASASPPEPVGETSLAASETVEATASATANAVGSKAPEATKTIPKATPPASTSVEKEFRVEPRIRVKWRVDAFIDGQGVYQGFVKDISLSGTDVFLDHNLQKVKFVKLRIYVPPLSKTSSPHVMEVSAKVRYTAYDSRESLFHTGVKFSQFNLESDHAYLQSRIATINRVM